MFESFLGGFGILFNPETVVMTFAWMAGGLFLGMFVGALPGFTTLMAMAILLPISFFIHPLLGIPFLIGVYKGESMVAVFLQFWYRCRALEPP